MLEGMATLEARDARPLLSVLFGKDLPGVVVRLTVVPRLAGSAWISVGEDRAGVVDLAVAGGDIALRGSYAASGGERTGGLVARKCFLSVGLGMNNDGTSVRLFGLDRWLQDRRSGVVQLLHEAEAR
jgi:hypothetical protein